VIVFGGNDEKPLTLHLDVDADEVAKSLRGHSLQRIEVKGRVIWVNPQNVLYVENATGSGLTTGQARGPNPSAVVE
jgi:hypothetical protein